MRAFIQRILGKFRPAKRPVYDQRFYNAIIAERRKLGATDQYVSIDECMRVVGRTFGDGQGDNSQS